MSFPTRRGYVLLALVFASLAVYASLVPFAFRDLTLDEAVARLRLLASQLPTRRSFSRSDAVANILLLIPLGFCLSGAFRLGARAWWSGPVTTIVVLALALPFSLSLEFLQLFTEGRTSSSGDVAAQLVGALVGNVLWETVGPNLSAWIHATLGTDTRQQRLQRLLAAYAVGWVLLSLAPFDLAFDVGALARKVRGDGLVLVPFGRARDTALELAWDGFRTMAAAFPLGVLAFLADRTDDTRLRTASACVVALGFLVTIEIAQFFVASRITDVTDIASGGLGVVLGILTASHWGASPPHAPERSRTWIPIVLLASWCAVIAAYHWMPYDFQWDGDLARRKLATVSGIPFAAYHRGPDLNSLDQLLLKLWLSAPLGALSALLAPRPGMWRRIWVAAWLVAATLVFTVVEAGQLFLLSRFPDPSDILVAMVGAAIGLGLTLWLLAAPKSDSPDPD